MRISINDVDRVSNGEGRSQFFKLKGNHDKAVVRFLHEGMNDISTVVVHEAKVDGRGRWINCLRKDINSPKSECPFCSSKNEDISFVTTRVYLELAVYELDRNGNPTGKYNTQIWERGKKFISKLQSLCNRYKPLCDFVFEIERLGDERSTDTTYEIYPISGATKAEYPYELEEVAYDPIGKIVLDRSFEDAQYFIENDEFPPKNEGVQRREVSRAVEEPKEYSQRSYQEQEEQNTQQSSEDYTPRRRRV